MNNATIESKLRTYKRIRESSLILALNQPADYYLVSILKLDRDHYFYNWQLISTFMERKKQKVWKEIKEIQPTWWVIIKASTCKVIAASNPNEIEL